MERECICDPATSAFLTAPYHSIECTHVILLQVKADLVFGSVLREAQGHEKLSLMSQKGNSNLKFARYPLEKSSVLTSLELKSKLQERLAEPLRASCESGGQHSLWGRGLQTVWGVGAVGDVE